MKALVLGYGRSGKAAEALLKAQGYEVVVLDGDDKVPWDAVGDSDSCNKNVASPLDAAGDSVVRDKYVASPLDVVGDSDSRDKNVASPLDVVGDSVVRDKNVASPLDVVGLEGTRHSCRVASVSAEGRDARKSLRAAEPPRPLFSFAVVSPGIALTHPWIAACRAHGIPLKSELQLGCEELKRRGWKLLAVTGSKGKSSVVKIVADAINLAGGQAVACGNYGVPVCEVAWQDRRLRRTAAESPRPQTSWAVVEVSSFMMETTELPADTFEAATILNLQEDHLDRHGSVEVYHGLKRKLLGFAKTAVGDSVLRDRNVASPLDAVGDSVVRDKNVASPLDAAGDSVLRDKNVASPLDAVGDSDSRDKNVASPLDAGLEGTRHSCRVASVSAEGRDARKSLRAAEPPRPLTALRGSYFDNPILRENGDRAIGLMRVAGLDAAAIEHAFRTFEPLPHRMNLIAETDGVRYIDDSKATSLAALAAGVEMAASGPCSPSPVPRPAIRLIAGGLPKGDDPKDVLSTLTKRVRKVYLIGQCAESFRSAWASSVDCEVCGTLERAVAAAMRDAGIGETVLLSPGTASFDQFKSFGERGDVFANLVKKGKTE